jgi:hypothetical protein
VEQQNGPFYSYSSYLKARYGARAYRVSVDAGFSCPNRVKENGTPSLLETPFGPFYGADRGMPGCTYCDERGSRAVYQEGRTSDGKGGERGPAVTEEDLKNQIKGGIRFLEKRYKARVFLLYFQAFSSTYAPVETLKKLYDYCLSLAPFKELIVSTRPDCVTAETAELFKEYKARGYEVWVELGLQSACDDTLKRINRGHTAADFDRSYKLLRGAGCRIAVHLIFGLPGEGEKEVLETVDYIRAFVPDGIKIHNLHIPFRTRLFQEYLRGEITAPSAPRHRNYIIKALERVPKSTIIIRLTCDTPESLLAAPRDFLDKASFIRSVKEEMVRRNTRQGRYYDEDK